jgi:hypothetical protein
LANGAILGLEDGNSRRQCAGVEALLYQLSNRFNLLAQELQITVLSEVLNFQRGRGEPVDDTIARFDLMRLKALQGANFVISECAWSWTLLTVLRIPRDKWDILLSPFLGSLPNNDPQYRQFVDHLRKHGHL